MFFGYLTVSESLRETGSAFSYLGEFIGSLPLLFAFSGWPVVVVSAIAGFFIGIAVGWLNSKIKNPAITAAIVAIVALIAGATFLYILSDAYVESVIQKAVRANDTSICKRLLPIYEMRTDTPKYGWHPREACYTEVAAQNKDLRGCLKDEALTGPCFESYFQQQKTSDTGICATLPDQSLKDECWLRQNLVMHDAKICSAIQSDSTKTACYTGVALYRKDVSLCSTYLSGDDAAFCREALDRSRYEVPAN